jgi:hypothetical protein
MDKPVHSLPQPRLPSVAATAIAKPATKPSEQTIKLIAMNRLHLFRKILRATAAAPLGADGFNPPSLLSIFAFPQTFFHGGATDVLSSATARAQLVKFLNSIDATTPPVNPPAPGTLTLANHFNYKSPSQAPLGVVDAYASGLAPSLHNESCSIDLDLPMAQRIKKWLIERLIPWLRNPRTHSDAQVAQIAASIASTDIFADHTGFHSRGPLIFTRRRKMTGTAFLRRDPR